MLALVVRERVGETTLWAYSLCVWTALTCSHRARDYPMRGEEVDDPEKTCTCSKQAKTVHTIEA